MDEWPAVRDHPVVKPAIRGRSIPIAVAWIPVGVAVLLYAPPLSLGLSPGGRLPQLLQFGWYGGLSPLVGIEFGIVGALLLRRHPGHALGSIPLIGGFAPSLYV